MKHLTDIALAVELENRQSALHHVAQSNPTLRPMVVALNPILREAALRLRQRGVDAKLAPERESWMPQPAGPRKRVMKPKADNDGAVQP